MAKPRTAGDPTKGLEAMTTSPSMGPIAKTRRHLMRYREIADVLVRHGLGNLADQLGLAAPARPRILGRRKRESLTVPVRVRMVLEELGPAFVKFGQILSTRPDLLPDDVIAELESLQDAIPPITYAAAAQVIHEELGAPVDALFARFDREPLAAASIGQVHRAALFDGTEVAVKVRRPGIEEQLRTDIEVLTDLADLAEHRTTWAQDFAVGELVTEFARTLEEQLDFSLEASYATRFRERLPEGGAITIPRVFWELTSERVLTMAYLDTVKANHIDELKAAGHDLDRIARTLMDHLLRESLLDGMFHGDPHPGNIGIASDGTIVFMDFGLVGFLDAELRSQIGDLIIGFVDGDSHTIATALMDVGRIHQRSQIDELSMEAGRLMRRYYERNLARLSLGEVLTEAVRLVVKYGARVPGEAALLVKTLVSIEGLALQLDPELKVSDIAKPVAHRLMEERFSPDRLVGLFRRNSLAAARIMAGFPERAERLLEKIEAGAVRMTVDLPEAERMQARMDTIANRVVVGILVSATLVASALMFRSGLGPSWQGIPILGAGGFVTGFAIGARLFFAIMKSGKI